jgi:hypothetical protein
MTVFQVLGFELRDLKVLYWLSYVSSSCLSDRVSQFFLAQASLRDCDPPTYASQVAGITDMHHHTRLVEVGSY